MSKVCYFASDVRLGGKQNPYVHLFSIREALAFGINLDMDFLEGIDQDEPGVIAWCENEEMFDFPAIWITEPYSEAPKSEKKHFAEVGGDPMKDLPGILAYIYDNMQEKNGEITKDLELWYVWLGNGEENLVTKTCRLSELTEETLCEVFADDDVDYKLTIVR